MKEFALNPLEEWTLEGDYQVNLSASFVDYPASPVIGQVEFVLTLARPPCNNPSRLTSQLLEDQTYVMTDLAIEYIVPGFIPTPAYCVVTYDVQSSPPFGGETFNFDPITGIFAYYADNDLGISDRRYAR